MASGLPVIVYDNPTNRFFLDELGIYADEMKPQALAKSIFNSLQDPPNSGLNLALRDRTTTLFSRESFSKKISDIYDRVLNNRA